MIAIIITVIIFIFIIVNKFVYSSKSENVMGEVMFRLDQCTGLEDSIFQCQTGGWRPTSQLCKTHTYDGGVYCYGKGIVICIVQLNIYKLIKFTIIIIDLYFTTHKNHYHHHYH